MSYNGWSNYETWNVKLWLDNDESSYNYWHEAANLAGSEIKLADQLKTEITEAAPDLGSSCYADLLNSALGEVDWYEIAKSLIDDLE